MKMKRYFLFVLLLALLAATPFETIAKRRNSSRKHKVNTENTTPKSNTMVDDKGHEYVDLGLPSGTLWATMNVGASSPEDYGDYFAWGETSPKQVYDWSTYKLCNGDYNKLTKYCTSSVYGTVDNKTELDPDNDAATANWGPDWRMPSQEQIYELRDKCLWKSIQLKGVKGYLVTSKYNGASLFFPAAGGCGYNLSSVGSPGFLWSSTAISSTSAIIMYMHESSVGSSSISRFYGISVRAVRVSQN